MAFRRTYSKTFKAKVTVNVANEEGGYDKSDFVAIFEHASSAVCDELRSLNTYQIIERKLVGWKMTDEDTKQDVPFTPENLAAVLLIPPVPFQICVAFWETINGARAKNS